MEKRKLIGGLIAVLLVAISAWAFGFFGGTDPALAALEELRDQMSNESLSDAQRDVLRDQFRDHMRHAFRRTAARILRRQPEPMARSHGPANDGILRSVAGGSAAAAR